MAHSNVKHHFWSFPWSYSQALVLGFNWLLIGWILEWLFPTRHFPALTWPLNVVILFSGVLLICCLSVFRSKNAIVVWMASVPTAITALSFFGLLAMIGGIVPQQSLGNNHWLDKLALTQLFQSWPFGLVYMWVLLTLGLAITQRLRNWKFNDSLFYLVHFGIWLTLAAAFFGSTDSERYKMVIQEGQTVAHAIDDSGLPHEMPFAIHLKDFEMETYLPVFSLIDPLTENYIKGYEKIQFDPKKDDQIDVLDWTIELTDYYPTAIKMKDTYQAVYAPGAVPAVCVKIKLKDDESVNWITCGNFAYPTEVVELGEYQLVMRSPRPRTFKSSVTLLTPDGIKQEEQIEVNHPISIKGWKIYQYSYDQKKGRWSTMSIFELRRDPWLPVVYSGMLLVLAGLFWLLIVGRFKKKEERL